MIGADLHRALIRPGVGRSVAGLAIGLTGVAMLTMSPGIGFDAAPGLLASEQRLAGRGNRLTDVLVADPDDLQRDVTQPVAWWPPGQQTAVHSLRRAGLSLEHSIKLIAVTAWGVGLAAWSWYHWLVLGDRRLLPWTIATVALFRLSHTGGFQFTGGETLLWGAFPVVVLLHLLASTRRGSRTLLVVAAGFLATALTVIKYSGGVLAAGLGLAWIHGVVRADAGGRPVFAWAAGASLGTLVVVLAGVSQLIGGLNPLTSARWHDPFAVVAWGLFGPLEAMSDLTEAATTLSRRLGGGPLSERATGLLSLALGALFLAWAAAARRTGAVLLVGGQTIRAHALRLAVGVTATTSIVLIALRLEGGDISWEARHHQYSMYLLLPFFAEALVRALRDPGRLLSCLSALCLVVFGLVPALYGGLVLARRALVGPTGIDREWSREGPGASSPLAAFSTVPGFDHALVATVSPRTALTFASQRVLFVMTLREGEIAASPDASWRSARFKGRPTGGVALVLPPGVSARDAETLLGSFDDVTDWTPIRLERAPGAQLWMGQ